MHNTDGDGHAEGCPGPSGGGGPFRDEYDNWVLGFSLNIGTTTSIVAELWAIRFGLQLAQNKGFNHLIVETDSQLSYNWLLTDDSNYPPLLTNLICDCRYLVQVGTQPHLLKNVYKEDNRVADALAEKGKKQIQKQNMPATQIIQQVTKQIHLT